MDKLKILTNPRPQRLKPMIPIGLILLLAIGLRLYQLGTESLWIDEMLSIIDAESIPSNMNWGRPLYYILLRLWMLFGSSDVWLRSLAVVFDIGGVFLIYQIGRHLFGESTGLVASFMMAISPLFINHAQEIRMYSLSSFLSLGGTLAMIYALKNFGVASLNLWAVSRALGILTTPLNLFLLLPDIIFFGQKNIQQFRRLFAFGVRLIFIGIVSLPTLWVQFFGVALGEFLARQVAGYSKPGIIQIFGMLTQFTTYYPADHLLMSHQIALDKDQLTDATLLNVLLASKAWPLFFYAGVTALLTLLLGMTLLRRPFSQLFLLIWGCAFLPAGCMLFVSYLKNSVWFPRYLLFIAPYFLLLIAAGFIVIWERKRWLATLVGTLYLIAVGGGLTTYYTTLYRNDWQGAAQIIRDYEQQGDIIIYYSIPKLLNQSLSRYYHDSARIYLLTPSKNKTLEQLIDEQGLEVPIQSRFWFVCWTFCDHQQEIKQIWQIIGDGNFTVQMHEIFQSFEHSPIEVYLLVPNSSRVFTN